MKQIYGKIGLISLACLLVWSGMAFAANSPNLAPRKIEIKRGYSAEAAKCIECHAEKTPGIYEDWKLGNMASAGISCYDCHVVESNSPMASQCSGLKGSSTFISPMVSSATCARCHPSEVDEFLKSGHANLSRDAVYDEKKAGGALVALQLQHEGAAFLGVEKGSLTNEASRTSGCIMCHGSEVELGPDNKPINSTWPAGVGT
ncbi:MAG: ammonia-forming cytochrome c nitrite reductase subunit c552, partial [Desulfuromusa sp.]|nr:ammonia-forming cytochrome c nitrite reductase subunit c552 [Desulfuromusa sp.]